MKCRVAGRCSQRTGRVESMRIIKSQEEICYPVMYFLSWFSLTEQIKSENDSGSGTNWSNNWKWGAKVVERDRNLMVILMGGAVVIASSMSLLDEERTASFWCGTPVEFVRRRLFDEIENWIRAGVRGNINLSDWAKLVDEVANRCQFYMPSTARGCRCAVGG